MAGDGGTNRPMARSEHEEEIRWIVKLGLTGGLVLLLIVCLVGSNKHKDEEEERKSGYWGEVTATMDWCERNYEVTIYAAEFWNTISNIWFVVFSIFGIWIHPHAEVRYWLCYVSVVVIGLGSAAFHGTLWFSSQLLDEIPMLYTSCCILFVCLEHPYKDVKRIYIAPLMVVGLTAFTVFYFHYPIATLFQLTWGGITGLTFYLTMIHSDSKAPPSDRKVGRVAVYAMLISGSMWVFEQAFCSPTIRMFRFHALWHCGTAYAAYCAITGLLFMRCYSVLKHKHTHYQWFGFLPVVCFEPPTVLPKKD